MVITMIDTKYKIKSKKNDIFPFINSVIMILFVIITLYPVLNTLAISLNDGTDALRGGIYLWPRKFTWKNYTTVLHKDNLITGAYITVARTLIGTCCLWQPMQSLLLLSAAKDSCSRERFPCSGSSPCM